MSEQKKTITINPDLFKVSGKQNAGRKPKTENIRIKSEMNNPNYIKSKTLKNRALKLIRAKQQEEYKRLFSDEKLNISADTTIHNNKPVSEKSNIESKFTENFNSSFEYLKQLSDKVESRPEHVNHNQTLKQYPSTFSNTYTPNKEPIISTVLPSELFDNQPHALHHVEEPPVFVRPTMSHPGYGCLKGGSYPTYRTWKNYSAITNTNTNSTPTISNHQIQPQPQLQQPQSNTYSAPSFVSNMSAPKETQEIKEIRSDIPAEISNINENLNKKSPATILLQQIHQKSSNPNPISIQGKPQHNYRIRNRRRRKIFNRTYRVGKTPQSQKIGCLISNKTVRQKIQQKCYEIKHTDIKEIRKYLLKHGFIKIGTTAPNDVLRKMYESVVTVCGEVENHNSETLLHNFLNDKEE